MTAILVSSYVLILAGVSFINTINEFGVDNPHIYFVILPQYQEMETIIDSAHELLEDGDLYVTGENSFFVVPVDSKKMLDIELKYIENGKSEGYIWYSQSYTFSEDPESYSFVLGHNPVKLKPETRYVKIMISSNPGVHYGLKGISYRNPVDAFSRINKGVLIQMSSMIWLVCIGAFCLYKGRKLKYSCQLSSLGFAAILLFTAGYVFWDFLVGNRVFIFADIGADTCHQYFPYYVNCVQRIREGSFGLWNWDYGLGTSLINNIAHNLDPFGLLVILGGVVLGADKVARLLLVSQLLKIAVSAFLCRYYLKIWDVSDRAANIGGYLYGFNGYLMLWGQHYLLGSICVYFPLLLIFLEKLIRNFRVRYVVGLAVTTAFSVTFSYYNTYMGLLFCGIYFVLRLLNPDCQIQWRDRIKKAGLCLFSVVVGLMIGGWMLLPSGYYLLNSSARLDYNTSVFARFWNGFVSQYSPDQIVQTFGRMMSNNLYFMNESGQPGWPNYYEMPQLCITIFWYLLLGQFLVQSIRRCKGWRHVLYGMFVATVGALLIFNPGIAIAFNGFAYLSVRYTFVIMPIAALLVAVEWDRLIIHHEFSLTGLLLGVAVSITLLMDAYGRATGEVKNYTVVVAILIVVFAILMLLLWKWKRARPYLLPLLTGCVFCSVCMEAYKTNNDRVTADEWSISMDRIADTSNAIRYLKEQDESFYRVDKLYADIAFFGDPLIARYSSVSEYNSTTNHNVLDFYHHLYSDVMVLGDAQRIVRWDSETYVNPMRLLNLKYILSRDTIEFPWLELEHQIGSTYIYRNKNASSVASFYTNTIAQSECEGMTEEERRRLLQDTLIVEDGYEKYHEKDCGTVEMGRFVKAGDGILGNIVNEKPGMLLLTIPDQEGWSVYVDDKKTEILNGDYGFIAVELAEGEHTIAAKYQIPYAGEGLLCSVVGIVILTGSCIIMHLIGKRRHAATVESV